MNEYVRASWNQKCLMAAIAITAFALYVFDTEDLMAQRGYGGRRSNKPKAERVSISGTLHSIIPQKRAVHVVTDDNQHWQAQLTDTTDVRVNGEGTAELLRPGLFVRFYGKLTRTGKGVEPIQELTVVTPDDAFRPGLSKEDDDREEEAIKDDDDDDLPPPDESGEEATIPTEEQDELPTNESAEGISASDDEKPDSRRTNARRRNRSKKPRVIAAERYWISGQIRSIKKKKLVVQIGVKSVRVEVDDKTQVVVEATDLRLARAGDHVNVHGSYYPDQPGFAKAYDIEITLATANPPAGGKTTEAPRNPDSKKKRLQAEPKEPLGEDPSPAPDEGKDEEKP